MPIEYRIDHSRRLVVARALGVLTDADVFGYQREVWSQPQVAGYDELMDMTQATKIAVASADRVRELAAVSAAMDPPASAAKFAVVAPQDFAFGLGRMFATYRGIEPGSLKQVAVFRSLPPALAFLGIEGPFDPWGVAEAQ